MLNLTATGFTLTHLDPFQPMSNAKRNDIMAAVMPHYAPSPLCTDTWSLAFTGWLVEHHHTSRMYLR